MKLSWTLDLEAVLETWQASYEGNRLEVCYMETGQSDQLSAHVYEWKGFYGRKEIEESFKSKEEAIKHMEWLADPDDKSNELAHSVYCHWDSTDDNSKCTCSK